MFKTLHNVCETLPYTYDLVDMLPNSESLSEMFKTLPEVFKTLIDAH